MAAESQVGTFQQGLAVLGWPDKSLDLWRKGQSRADHNRDDLCSAEPVQPFTAVLISATSLEKSLLEVWFLDYLTVYPFLYIQAAFSLSLVSVEFYTSLLPSFHHLFSQVLGLCFHFSETPRVVFVFLTRLTNTHLIYQEYYSIRTMCELLYWVL